MTPPGKATLTTTRKAQRMSDQDVFWAFFIGDFAPSL